MSRLAREFRRLYQADPSAGGAQPPVRALLLEACGYETKVFEFVSLEHTNKNKMILAVKRPNPIDPSELLEKISAIKQFYGISEQCLETLLKADGRI